MAQMGALGQSFLAKEFGLAFLSQKLLQANIPGWASIKEARPSRAGPILPDLCKSGPAWADLGRSGLVLAGPGLVWAGLGRSPV